MSLNFLKIFFFWLTFNLLLSNFLLLLLSVSEALFRLCRGTNNSTLFGVCPTFRSRTTAFIIFFSFLCGFLFLLVREKHRKTLYRFLFRKIKACKSTTQGG